MAGLAVNLYMARHPGIVVDDAQLNRKGRWYTCLECRRTLENTRFWGKQLICKRCDHLLYDDAMRHRYFQMRQGGWNNSRKGKSVPGRLTYPEWRALVRKYGNRCLCCKRRFPLHSLEPDHVVPFIQGGSNDVANMQPLCMSCNISKNGTYFDYRPESKSPP